jgi:hypothetical protein
MRVSGPASLDATLDWHDASWALTSGRQQVSTGQITVWTSDPSPSPIEVLVDGVVVGQLTAYRTEPPGCGMQSAGAVTVERRKGVYSLLAREIAGSACWCADEVNVSAEQCYNIELRR